MINSGDYNFSFSGLKTAVLYTLEKQKKVNKQDVSNICASFQQAVVDILVSKTIKLAKEKNIKSVMLAGGVAANTLLKETLKKEVEKLDLPFFCPEVKYTGDNAAMIAVAGYYNLNKDNKGLKGKDLLNLEPKSNWQLVKNRI